MFRRRPGHSQVAHPLGIELPRRTRAVTTGTWLRPVEPASRRPEPVDPVSLRRPSPHPEPAQEPRASTSEASVLAEKRLAKVMKQLALQEVELARLRAADNAASQQGLSPQQFVGASEDRASRNRGAMTAIFQANVQLRRDLESSSLNS